MPCCAAKHKRLCSPQRRDRAERCCADHKKAGRPRELPADSVLILCQTEARSWPNRVMRSYTTRLTCIRLISAIALAGFSPLGQVLAQFMIVWQR